MKKKKEIGYCIGCPHCACGGLGLVAGKNGKQASYTIWEERKDAVQEALMVKDITGEMPMVYEVTLRW